MILLLGGAEPIQSTLRAIESSPAVARGLEAWDLLPPEVRAGIIGLLVLLAGVSFVAGRWLLPAWAEVLRARGGSPSKNKPQGGK